MGSQGPDVWCLRLCAVVLSQHLCGATRFVPPIFVQLAAFGPAHQRRRTKLMPHLRMTLLGSALMFAVGSLGAGADPKPSGAKAANPQVIANYHAGKTHIWKNCKGGIYYGSNWQAQAWCERDGKAVGLGTWKVDGRGKICHELTWYWKGKDGVGSRTPEVTEENCHEHLVDGIGTIWRSWGGEKDWWPLAGTKSLVKGFKHKSKVSRLRNQLGV